MMMNGLSRSAALPFLPAKVLAFTFPEGMEYDLVGSDITVIDLPRIDLNSPQRLGKFSLVLDPGALDHVANVGQALQSALESVAVKGHIVQVCPLSMHNHGYWAYTPQLIRDVYTANGFDLETFVACRLYTDEVVSYPMDRSTNVPGEAWLLVVAKHVKDMPWVWPIQKRWYLDKKEDLSCH